MIITKNIEVKIGGKNIKHYKSLGYNMNLYDKIVVPIYHLSNGSHYKILVRCDYCLRDFKKTYKSLVNERKNRKTKKDCCKKCIYLKTKETNLSLYGVENGMKRMEVREKLKNKFLSIFGVENPSQHPDIAKKISTSQREMSSEKKREKKLKTLATVRSRYGLDSVLQLEKTRKNLFVARSSESSPQLKIFEMLSDIYGKENVQKNYSLSKLSLDVLLILNDTKIDVEYDSWYWHNPNSDRRRDEFVKSLGYKILRIRSAKKIPSVVQLTTAISYIIKYNSNFEEILLEDWNADGYIKEGRIS